METSVSFPHSVVRKKVQSQQHCTRDKSRWWSVITLMCEKDPLCLTGCFCEGKFWAVRSHILIHSFSSFPSLSTQPSPSHTQLRDSNQYVLDIHHFLTHFICNWCHTGWLESDPVNIRWKQWRHSCGQRESTEKAQKDYKRPKSSMWNMEK